METPADRIIIPLEIESDVTLARDEARAVAVAMGFDELAQSQVALGVSEICQNAIRHAGGGVATITTRNKEKVLQIIVEDKGVGIANIPKIMEEGYSTISTSLGIGMDVAKRSMDKFQIATEVNKGTVITLEKHLPLPSDLFDFGVVSLPDEGYEHNGDEFLIKEYDGDKILLAIIDGLGQGYDAHLMAVAVKKIINENYFLPLTEIIALCDEHLKATLEEDGGVAMSLARIVSDKVTYLGVGDTHCYIQKDDLFPMLNIDGRVGGRQLRSLTVKEFVLKAEDVILLCTDGIQTAISFDLVPMNYSAQNMANLLFNQFHRVYGDVTIMVVKCLRL